MYIGGYLLHFVNANRTETLWSLRLELRWQVRACGKADEASRSKDGYRGELPLMPRQGDTLVML